MTMTMTMIMIMTMLRTTVSTTIMSLPTRTVFTTAVRTSSQPSLLLLAYVWWNTNPSTLLRPLFCLHSLPTTITTTTMWTVLHPQHLLPRMISIPQVHLQSLVDRLALDYVRGREWTMYSWTMVSTANPILLIPPHHQQQQSHLQINLRKEKKSKERWWMLTNRQTLPLNPYSLVSSTSQMNGLPMRWIVLCLPVNHSWMHFERFTSLRLFDLHISSLHCLLPLWYWRWNRQSKEALQIQGRLCEWVAVDVWEEQGVQSDGWNATEWCLWTS